MKLKALAGMCKREGTFYLYDRVDPESGEVIEQWLGTAGAVYPLPALPYLTEDHLAALFDITEKQRENVYFRHTQIPEWININHAAPDEIMLDREKMTLGYENRIVRPLMTRDGLEFIDNDFLTPIADVADSLELYERHADDGQVYFVAKVGFMVVAVFMPLSLIEEKFVENMEELAEKCRTALKLKYERDAQRKAANAVQMTLSEEEGRVEQEGQP